MSKFNMGEFILIIITLCLLSGILFPIVQSVITASQEHKVEYNVDIAHRPHRLQKHTVKTLEE